MRVKCTCSANSLSSSRTRSSSCQLMRERSLSFSCRGDIMCLNIRLGCGGGKDYFAALFLGLSSTRRSRSLMRLTFSAHPLQASHGGGSLRAISVSPVNLPHHGHLSLSPYPRCTAAYYSSGTPTSRTALDSGRVHPPLPSY